MKNSTAVFIATILLIIVLGSNAFIVEHYEGRLRDSVSLEEQSIEVRGHNITNCDLAVFNSSGMGFYGRVYAPNLCRSMLDRCDEFYQCRVIFEKGGAECQCDLKEA